MQKVPLQNLGFGRVFCECIVEYFVIKIAH